MIKSPDMLIYPAYPSNGMAVIACPGGAYSFLASQKEGADFAAWFNKLGITFAVLNYRMPEGDCLAPMQDLHQAMCILQKYAPVWKYNPDQIGVIGFSAGGHLATTHLANPPRPRFQILFYPVISMKDSITHQNSRKNLLGANPSPELINSYSNECHITDTTPPTFIICALDDPIVNINNSLVYFDSLCSHKIPSTLFLIPAGGHGFGFSDRISYKQIWMKSLKDWIHNLKTEE